MPGVRRRHARPSVGGPDLQQHHRLLLGVGCRQRGTELGSRAKALDVAGDHRGVVVVGKVFDEVAHLEVHLVAARHLAAESNAEMNPLHDGPPVVARLGNHPDLAPPQPRHLRHRLERIGVGVGSEDADVVAATRRPQLRLQRRPLRPDLAEPRREHQRVANPRRTTLVHHRSAHRRRRRDHRQRHRLRHISHRLIDRHRPNRPPLRVHQMPVPHPPPAIHRPPQPSLRLPPVNPPNNRHPIRMKELL